MPENDVAEKPDALEAAPAAGRRRVRRRQLRYPGDRPRDARGVTFSVEPDTTVAVVGATGSGKTSRQPHPALLRRDRDACSSTAIDVRDVTLESLRAPDRHRDAGHRPVLRHGARQHRVRPAGRHRRGRRGRRARRAGRRVHPCAAGGLRHARRRARRQALRRPAPAHRHRPGAARSTRASSSWTTRPRRWTRRPRPRCVRSSTR